MYISKNIYYECFLKARAILKDKRENEIVTANANMDYPLCFAYTMNKKKDCQTLTVSVPMRISCRRLRVIGQPAGHMSTA